MPLGGRSGPLAPLGAGGAGRSDGRSAHPALPCPATQGIHCQHQQEHGQDHRGRLGCLEEDARASATRAMNSRTHLKPACPSDRSCQNMPIANPFTGNGGATHSSCSPRPSTRRRGTRATQSDCATNSGTGRNDDADRTTLRRSPRATKALSTEVEKPPPRSDTTTCSSCANSSTVRSARRPGCP